MDRRVQPHDATHSNPSNGRTAVFRRPVAWVAVVVLSASLLHADPGESLLPAAPQPLAVVDGQVVVMEESRVSAFEAGVLTSLEVRDGLVVEVGQELGRLNDEVPTVEKRLAMLELEAARTQALDDVHIRYSKAVKSVAEAELAQGREANLRGHNVVNQGEMRRRELAVEQAKLEIEKAQREHLMAQTAVKSREAAVDKADLHLRRRSITAPISGMVFNVYRQLGEWVNPGEPVLRIVRMDKFKVEAFLEARHFGVEVAGFPVSVEAETPGGQVEFFVGKIIFASPEIEPVNGQFRVTAEVVNRDQRLRPGMNVRMHLHHPSRTARSR